MKILLTVATWWCWWTGRRAGEIIAAKKLCQGGYIHCKSTLTSVTDTLSDWLTDWRSEPIRLLLLLPQFSYVFESLACELWGVFGVRWEGFCFLIMFSIRWSSCSLLDFIAICVKILKYTINDLSIFTNVAVYTDTVQQAKANKHLIKHVQAPCYPLAIPLTRKTSLTVI